ncbi:SGNH/GDSL hydrolase family protein [Streptomyces violaceusniger]|uniref:SGNH/GDSL hydrolase family protein n=1 Tax=Streptomyces violaceusniger TaxID=68280 RepID=UPI0020736C60|nr:SGNH/GDSL hydrolase family protein [Streptomyces violaceusniger]
MATVELWLPFYHQFRLCSLSVEAGAALEGEALGRQPRWVHCGSSISQGRGAASPSRTWTALVARRTGWDLTSLALGTSSCLEPMTARLMRDLPADLLTLCVGVNVQALGSHNRDALVSALVGFVRTVREGHPTTPFAVMPGRRGTPPGSSTRAAGRGAATRRRRAPARTGPARPRSRSWLRRSSRRRG